MIPCSLKGRLKLRGIFNKCRLIHCYALRSHKICKLDTILNETWYIELGYICSPSETKFKIMLKWYKLTVGKLSTELHKLHIRNVEFQTDVGINAIIFAQSRNLPPKYQASSRKETPNKQWVWYRHLNPANILQIYKLTPILFYFASSIWYRKCEI